MGSTAPSFHPLSVSPKFLPVLNSLPPNTDLSKPEALAKSRSVFGLTHAQVFTDPEIEYRDEIITGGGGQDLIITIITKKGSSANTKTKRPGIFYLHAGGQIMGSRFFLLAPVFSWIKATDAVLTTIEYRLAPEHPYPAALDDAYAALKWTIVHSHDLGINLDKLLIAGTSAGGGLAAALALKVRDDNRRAHEAGTEKPQITFIGQILICPMLDDRSSTISMHQFAQTGTWTGAMNKVAWPMILPSSSPTGPAGSAHVSPYAAPARADDLSGLPRTFIEVGGAEPFRDECVQFAEKLWRAGVETELHVWGGGFHCWDVYTPEAYQSVGAGRSRVAWLRDVLLKGSGE